MGQSLPGFGNLVLCVVLAAAGYTIALALAAAAGRPRYLALARLGAYATSSLVGLAIVLLAYAFVTHDFRLRYVASYSDRSLSTPYLLAALWGGQDGSLLWWAALLAGYTAVCVRWMHNRFRVLQPFVIATLMVVMAFFTILMLFASNPFQTHLAATPPEGQGLNPLLQSPWMVIHPPMLYLGFVGCTIPFAFAVAALVTGRLDNLWILAARKWVLFAWLALSLGNALGMIWAYEELGWGGFWAWDPVENASALPWFTATAYLHSTMIQERRGMLKTWNVVLVVLTFLLTLFGTFLTRSGLISSVHGFAKSDIGVFFLVFMALVGVVSLGLCRWRRQSLRAVTRVEALMSREATFVLNNWALLGLMTFVALATIFPKLSEWLYAESLTVAAPFYNRWAAPLGLVIFGLMGLAPLFGWRKTSSSGFWRALWPLVLVTAAVAVWHGLWGARWGLPARVPRDLTSPGLSGWFLRELSAITPWVVVTLAAFNLTVVIREFLVGVRARRTTALARGEAEPWPVALWQMMTHGRRRYGGYLVHLGITLVFLGFVGASWSTTKEVSLHPGQTVDVAGYRLRYVGPRICPGDPRCTPEEQSDVSKTMAFADVDVEENGRQIARLSPARFMYRQGAGMATTEVGLLRGWVTDLYLVAGEVSAESPRAALQIHVNRLVSFLWCGVVLLILGAALSLWPEFFWGPLGVLGLEPTTAPTRYLAWLVRWGPLLALLVLATVAWWGGVARLLLVLAGGLLVLAMLLVWHSLAAFSRDREVLTLDEAFEMAQPAQQEEQKLSVLRALKDLESERQLGKIAEEDYVALSARYRAEARELMTRMDESEAGVRAEILEHVRLLLQARDGSGSLEGK